MAFKRLIIFLAFMAISSPGIGQVNIILDGLVLDSLTAQPIPFKPVNITVPNDSLTVNAVSDSQGRFTTSLDSISQGTIEINIVNCQSNNVQFVLLVPTSSGTLSNSFAICDTIPPPCIISFQDSIDGFMVSFSPLISPQPTLSAFYQWDFGDGTISSQINPTHTYLSPGKYQVCLSYSDPGSPFCWGTYCDSITILPPCAISFTHSSYGPTSEFQSVLTGSQTAAGQYLWDFGDGNTSGLPSPKHSYSNGGDYLVCLSYLDGQGCNTNFCDSIQILYDSSLLTLSGSVIHSGSPSSNPGTVLYVQNSTGGFDQVQRLTDFSDDYIFYNLIPGNYLVRSEHPTQNQLVPTYWQSGMYWDDGTTLFLQSSLNSIDIQVLTKTQINKGPGKIQGSVSGPGGNPIPNAFVGLEDSLRRPIDFVDVGINNSFLFEELPHGKYWLGVDLPGVPTVRKVIRLSPQKNADTANYILQGGWLISGQKKEIALNKIAVFPNPFNDQLKLMGIINGIDVRIECFDPLGKMVMTRIEQESDELRVHFPENINPGIYFLKITTAKEVRLLRIKKKGLP